MTILKTELVIILKKWKECWDNDALPKGVIPDKGAIALGKLFSFNFKWLDTLQTDLLLQLCVWIYELTE